MIEQAFEKLTERENRELCVELLKRGAHYWDSYAGKPGNLDFFDGIMHTLTLPKDSLLMSINFIIHPLNDLNKKNATKITNSLMSVKDASYWNEVDITEQEKCYLVGLYYILASILLDKRNLRIDGAKLIHDLLAEKDREIDISVLKKQVKNYSNAGHQAPDV
jgi:hypothetical protein